ncbi:MAG: DUF3240 family protein [Colwellia sp.]|nr:DUF3240 family protein [Colwellia sp.]
MIKDEDKAMLLAQLTPICQAEKLRYWLMPISESGHFKFRFVVPDQT